MRISRNNARAVAFLFVIALPSAASGRTVGQFLTEMQVVQAGGVAAMFNAQARSLLDEANTALRQWDIERVASPRRICASANASDMSPEQFTNLLLEVPPPERGRIEVLTAVRSILNRRHRCP